MTVINLPRARKRSEAVKWQAGFFHGLPPLPAEAGPNAKLLALLALTFGSASTFERDECGGAVMPASTHAAAQSLNETVEHLSIKPEVVKDQKTKANRDDGHDEDHGHQQEFHVAYPTRRISPTRFIIGGNSY